MVFGVVAGWHWGDYCDVIRGMQAGMTLSQR